MTNARIKARRFAHAHASVKGVTLDEAVKTTTAFQSFEDLITTSTKDGYRPTLRSVENRACSAFWQFREAILHTMIADAFDAHFSAVGLNNRAFRGN